MQEFKTVEELLSDPSRWTTHASARDSIGRPVDSRDYRACQWCLLGAVDKVYPYRYQRSGAWSKIRDQISGYCFIGDWNDAKERSHEEVLEVVRKAGI